MTTSMIRLDKKLSSPKLTLELRVGNGDFSSLENIYIELKKPTKPTERGNSLKDVKKIS